MAFGANLSSIKNALSVWKKHFPVFSKFLSDEFETVFWESEAKCSNLFKSKLGHKNLLRKWFWSNLKLKNKCYDRLKKIFSFSFLQIFQWRSWIHCLGSEAKPSKPFKSKFGNRKLLRKSFWNYLELKKECSDRLKSAFFQFFSDFLVTKLKLFSGKVRQGV